MTTPQQDTEVHEWTEPCPGCGNRFDFSSSDELKIFEGKYWHAKCMPAYAEIDGRFYRICEGCTQPIIRNLAFLNGVPYHYGELRDSGQLDKATHVCRDCSSYLTLDKVVISEVDGERWRTCGVCGGQNLKWLGKHEESQSEVIY